MVFVSFIFSLSLSGIPPLDGVSLSTGSLNHDSLQTVCDIANSAETQDISSLYAKSSIIAISKAPECKIIAVKGAKEIIEGTAKAQKPVAQDLYYALAAAANMGIKVSENDFVAALTTAMKEGSASRFFYVFLLVKLLKLIFIAAFILFHWQECNFFFSYDA